MLKGQADNDGDDEDDEAQSSCCCAREESSAENHQQKSLLRRAVSPGAPQGCLCVFLDAAADTAAVKQLRFTQQVLILHFLYFTHLLTIQFYYTQGHSHTYDREHLVSNTLRSTHSRVQRQELKSSYVFSN